MRSGERRALAIGIGSILIGLPLVSCAASPAPERDAERPTNTPAVPSARPSDAPSAGRYADGSFEARGWYGSLPSHHDVSLTISGGIVTDVSITTPAEDETSLGYQRRFAAALPGAVIGRPIDELDVDRLAGSSGCSEGFMAALEQIKDAAHARS